MSLQQLAKAAVEGEESGGGRTPMQRANQEMARLRSASTNALHMGILMYGSRGNLVRQRIIQAACWPTAAFYGEQNRELRG